MSGLVMSNIRTIKTIDGLIQSHQTGSPDDLAKKVDMSPRNVYVILKFMRSLGAAIEYSPTLKSYYYQNGGGFQIGFLPRSEISKMN
jgi:hypothetical protein